MRLITVVFVWLLSSWLNVFAQNVALPAPVIAALQRAKVPVDALHVVVMEANGSQKTLALLSHQSTTSINPASLSKLATTVAALDLLGPTFVWRTPVYIDGPVRDGVLQGNIYVRGSGDPRLVVERIWLLMRRLQGLGIQKIQGDIVLDRSAFDLPERNPASFDGEPLRPYNAAPDALLVNFKSLVFQFVPDRASNVVRIQVEPPLAGVQFPTTVPLSNTTAVVCAQIGQTRFAFALQVASPQSVAKKFGLWPMQHLNNLPHVQ
jgi:D-alanyl-D-alanine carboxypeptidase/D-alanyl-D-alanine-endopeptidase (penicillin-binding protein 4)